MPETIAEDEHAFQRHTPPCSGNVKKWMTDNKLKMNNLKQKSCYVAPRNMLNLLIVIIFVSRVRISHFVTTQEIWGCILIAHFQWNIM